MQEKQFVIPSPGTYRFGEAKSDKHPQSIRIGGRLSAPYDFLLNKDKETQYNANYSHLILDKDSMMLELHLDEKSPHCEDIITGKLSPDYDLSIWSINSDKRWTIKEFVKFLRARKFFFKDGSQHTKLIESLQKWNVSFERVIKDENNNTGNSISSIETKISDIAIDTKFQLEMPIYKGYGKSVFEVEIGFDPKATSVELFLVSGELFELERSKKEAIFTEELKKFDSLGFNCSKINIS